METFRKSQSELEENPNSDYLITPGAEDSISSISWHPKNEDIIAAGSWDCTVRCWNINDAKTNLIASISHKAPVLWIDFNGEGTKLFSGGCDNQVLCWDLISNKPLLAGEHDGPVKYVHWLEDRNCLMTASWDQTIKYWDGRSSNDPVLTYQLEEKVYAADVKDNLAVVGLAEKKILIFDLNYPQKPFRSLDSPLKFQTRSISCFIDYKGFAVGSIEGRVAIHHCEPRNQNLNFAFKCHRDVSQIYAINSIDFHPIYNTFATTGADGLFHFWDKDAKQRLKQFKKMPVPISCSKFNPTGNIFAYSASYDWSQGCEKWKDYRGKGGLYLHSVAESEIKGRNTRRF